MKILFIITSLANGGAERVCASLANHFSKKHEVELVYFGGEIFYEILPSVKLSLIKPAKNRLLRPLSKLGKIRAKCDENDVCVSFMDSTNILVLLANMFSKNKIIISEHSQNNFLSLKWRILRRIFYPFAYALSVLTRADFEYYSFVKKREIIYNPVPFSHEFCQNKENLIIFVGRLEKVKGCDIFLTALSLLDLKGFKVRVLGDGNERKTLENQAKELELEVEFCGNVKEIQKQYKAAKIIVSSSLFEGLGNALIESMFFDCIRVSTPTNGAKELIDDEKDGFLSPDFSPQSLAKSIQKALSADENIIKNARKKCEFFSLENIEKKWQELMK